jgi:HAD superfamily hydrolase (TIGR01549 family)
MTLERERIRALLFDIDGTLSDTDDHMKSRLVKFLNPVRWLFKDKDPQSFAHWLIMAAESPGNFMYSAMDTIGVDKYFARYFDYRAQRKNRKRQPSDLFIILPGIKEMLSDLAGHYPMAVVSARNAYSSNLFLKHFGLESFFKVVVTSQTCPHTKPYPDPLLYAARELGVTIEDCLMIGDTIVDVHAALAAGAKSVSVLCGFGREKELHKAGTHAILTTTSQLSHFLKGDG